MMQRFYAIVQYDGNSYCGWQNQKHNPCSVQFFLDQAISKFTNEEIVTYAAGRTDAGVHANYQVVHFDSRAIRNNDAWIMGINSYLPLTIRVKNIGKVDEEFHARFSAKSRTYHYYILNTAVLNPFLNNKITWIPQNLEVNSMHCASQCLIGEHDFSSFRASECQSKSPLRNISTVDITQKGDIIACKITANAFLHSMVRNIVGSLIQIGLGRKSIPWLEQVLHAKDRTKAGPKAAASGLYLQAVNYDKNYGLPQPEINILEH